ncbi:MAG: hypothetical protein GEU99_09445 [Luteitalea sp.]|nr:hypothetical protein [Luteitalea sp.]
MADEVNDAARSEPLTDHAATGSRRDDLTGSLAEIELVPGGAAWMVERTAERGRVLAEWPLPPGMSIRVRSGGRSSPVGSTAQILRSELIALRPGRPPLYEGVLSFSPPDA